MNREALSEELSAFIEKLRTVGYNIGAAQHIAAQDLILALAARGQLPAELTQLCSLLGPVLCSSPEEQADFNRHFKDWADRYEKFVPTQPETPMPEVREKQEKSGKGGHIWEGIPLLMPLGLLMIIILIYWLYTATANIEVNLWIVRLIFLVSLVSLILALLPKLSKWFGWRIQNKRFLARRSTTEPPDLVRLFVETGNEGLFKSLALARIAQQLCKPIQSSSHQIDVEATVEKTIQAGGWFKPVSGFLKILPEYLVLVDRNSFKDHQSHLVNALVNRLITQGVPVTRYYFDADPRLCYPEQKLLPPCSLAELAERYPCRRLMIFSDGHGLVDTLSGELFPWFSQFSTWARRALFTLESAEEWGYRERLLSNTDFPVMPATEAGLNTLAEYLNDDALPFYPYVPSNETDDHTAQYPALLREPPYRWLDRHAPETEEITELLGQVRTYLGGKAYYWFSACAVYPQLHWQLSLYLGYQLKDSEGKYHIDEASLIRLVRLPWFRHGYMPNWLREKLVKDLSLNQEQEIRNALQSLLVSASPYNPLRDLRLEFAKDPGLAGSAKRLFANALKRAKKNSPLRDYVFQTFMEDRLAVKAPKWLRAVSSPLLVSVQNLLHTILFPFLWLYRVIRLGTLGILLAVVATASWFGNSGSGKRSHIKSEDENPYDLGVVRKLLGAVFHNKDDEFMSFCLKYFPFKFEVEIPFLWKVELFLNHCHESERCEELLSHLRDIDEEQYEKFLSAIRQEKRLSSLWSTLSFKRWRVKNNQKRSQCKLTLNTHIDFSEFTPEIRYAVIGAFSGVLDTPREEIKVYKVREESVVLDLPSAALDRLIFLFQKRASVIKELGVSHVIETFTEQYNMDNIRLMLTKMFTASELRNFCHENFRNVPARLSQESRKTEIIDELIKYAYSEHKPQEPRIPHLLELCYKHNSKVYAKYRPYYNVPRSPSDQPKRTFLYGMKPRQFARTAAMGVGVATIGTFLMTLLSLNPFPGNFVWWALIPLGILVGNVVSKEANPGRSLAVLSLSCYLTGYILGPFFAFLVLFVVAGGDLQLMNILVLLIIRLLSFLFEFTDPYILFKMLGLGAGGYYAYTYAR